jgi:molecular chaperone GrpE
MKNSQPEMEPRRRVEVSDEEQPPNDNAAAADDDGSAGLQADLERFRDLALRSQADFDNFKKRANREIEEAIKYANSNLLERLVAIVDNFELGLTAAKTENPQSPILAGMGMVLKQLTDFLADNGLQPIDAEGQLFDPNLHEAVAHEPNETVPEGKVVRQMRRGYKLKDRLLRPSSVVVSSGP